VSDVAAAIVTAYFDAIRARDVDALRELFAPDAELVTTAGVVVGRDAVAAFYRDSAFQIDDLEPRPGPLLVDGTRVAVEIELRIGGRVAPVADFFTIEDGRIRRLAIYSGPPGG
jgi:ketosteroid isomerase-like protein